MKLVGDSNLGGSGLSHMRWTETKTTFELNSYAITLLKQIRQKEGERGWEEGREMEKEKEKEKDVEDEENKYYCEPINIS